MQTECRAAGAPLQVVGAQMQHFGGHDGRLTDVAHSRSVAVLCSTERYRRGIGYRTFGRSWYQLLSKPYSGAR